MNKQYQRTTKAIRSGYETTHQQEHCEALFLTSSFVFETAQQAHQRFAAEQTGNIYSRFTNPTVVAFEKRLAQLENAPRCVATASGMAAIFTTVMALLKSGDHMVVARQLFGSSLVLFNQIVVKFGIRVSFVDLTDLKAWQAQVRPQTKLFFLETPSNPLNEVVDIKAIVAIAKAQQIYVAVDNCFLTSVLQQPLSLGADIVIHSATKYIDGQGRCLGGAILASEAIIEPIFSFIRTTGPSLSAFNAWLLLKGLETLHIRMQAHCDNALLLARWLKKQNGIESVHYLGLKEHPQHALACKQQQGFGGIVSFVVKGGREAAWRLIDATKLLSITANLGDVKSTITHPSTTTHYRLSDKEKVQNGISEGLLRVSVGLEAIEDIIADIRQGLPCD